MTWLPAAETVAQIAVERILNPLPEGLLVAIFAWALLRVFPGRMREPGLPSGSRAC